MVPPLGATGEEGATGLHDRPAEVVAAVVPTGTNASYRTDSAGHGNVTGYIAVSMAVYGAMLACVAAGATVSVERAQGWSRQLRLASACSRRSRRQRQSAQGCQPVQRRERDTARV